MCFSKSQMGKGGLYVYIRAPCDCPENMKLKKLILEKKKKFKKMKNKNLTHFTHLPTQ